MWSSDSKALPTGLWVSTTTITSPCSINTDVKQPPTHLFFRQDSVNYNTLTQVRRQPYFSVKLKYCIYDDHEFLMKTRNVDEKCILLTDLK